MKIAITTQGPTLDSEVDPRFGRAAGFILYDTETDKWSHHDNAQNLNAPQGAGIQAGQNVADLGAQWVLTGHCGPKAFRVLTANGIKIGNGATGAVADVVKQFNEGGFTAAADADVEGHWA